MAEVRIQAESRTEFGKGAARRLRRAHKIPGNTMKVAYTCSNPPSSGGRHGCGCAGRQAPSQLLA